MVPRPLQKLGGEHWYKCFFFFFFFSWVVHRIWGNFVTWAFHKISLKLLSIFATLFISPQNSILNNELDIPHYQLNTMTSYNIYIEMSN